MEPPPPVERPSGDEGRVPVRTVKPSATAFARSVWQFASGTVGDAFAGRLLGRSADQPTAPTIDAMTFAPLEVRETGAVVVPELGGYALALTTSPRVPQADIDLALSGLALAGARFDGEVEEVSTGTG